MLLVKSFRLEPSLTEALEDCPWLDQQVLFPSRSLLVCGTFHVFRPHRGPSGRLLLACHRRQGLGARGDDLSGAVAAKPGERRAFQC